MGRDGANEINPKFQITKTKQITMTQFQNPAPIASETKLDSKKNVKIIRIKIKAIPQKTTVYHKEAEKPFHSKEITKIARDVVGDKAIEC